ncbi:Gfo/Idh/MocA family protein [Streptomyces sp. NBC_00083]|uniref:Gfo/Idh/MocA family protein n=1 Tax=Streptomyces sp. NBC_00083 TaxID=2975647 RepID=UPI002259F12C|nr:Gfo/Idh/MocA family oxidoreductase [Streptomyces sp. NBC_00083]MCX5382352.1 Gfo/Idh/MocA family oxidoreductase [Streptomyces sp. NBC_00083]
MIVGYGHAGRDLHHAALRTLHGADRTVFVVDPALREAPPGVRLLPSLRAVAECGPVAQTVFHVTTPPGAHVACVERLVALGARRVILEKPIAPTAEESARLRGPAGLATILPVSVWPNSRVTREVRSIIASGEIGEPVALFMEQSKPRFGRTSSSDAHHTAFEVELPHQVLLALHLAGPRARMLSSTTWAMPLPDRVIPGMGGAVLRLEHENGTVSTLLSDLTSPARRRHLRVTGTRGEIAADFPVGADDPFGQIRISGRPGRTVVEDAPLTRFVEAAYACFTGEGPPPPAGLDLHQRAIGLLEQARERAVPAAFEEAVAG